MINVIGCPLNTGFSTLEDNWEPSIFPNPTKDKITIEVTEPDLVQLKLFSTIGECLYSESFIHHTSLHLVKFPKGVYFLELKTKDKQIIKKVIRE